jgi:hypothetical protein
VLLTHGCAIDKVDKATDRPRAEFVQFSRLRLLNMQPTDRQGQLRRKKLGPYEAVFAGEIETLGESFFLLSDTYFLPFEYFDPTVGDFADHPDAPDDVERYIVANAHDTRIDRMSPDLIALLHRKMSAFWTREDTLGRARRWPWNRWLRR